MGIFCTAPASLAAVSTRGLVLGAGCAELLPRGLIPAGGGATVVVLLGALPVIRRVFDVPSRRLVPVCHHTLVADHRVLRAGLRNLLASAAVALPSEVPLFCGSYLSNRTT